MKIYLVKKERGRVYKSEAIAACILEREGAEALFGQAGIADDGLRFSHDEGGRPVVLDADGYEADLYMSVTDTKQHWLAVFSGSPVGLDAEERTRRAKATVVKALHPLEQQYLAGLEYGSSEWQAEFLRIWTAKEAYSKYCGEGLRIGFAKFSVLDPDLNYLGYVTHKDRPGAFMQFGAAGELYITIASQVRPEDGIETEVFKYEAPFKETALETAAEILDRKNLSTKELERQLNIKGYSREDVDEAVDTLKERSYLDDRAFARSYAERAMQQGKGRVRIESELALKGIPKDVAREILDGFALNDDAVSEEDRAMGQALKLLRGKDPDQPPDEKTQSKIARKLASLGYSNRVVYSVLEKLRG